MKGVFTALVTPFDSTGRIDWESFKKILAEQRDAKITGVIPCGTTGESPSLDLGEKKALISATLQAMKDTGVKVLAGTGGNNTTETVEFSKWASDQGVDGVLVVTPYYNKPSQAGLETHFRTVADAVRCEVMLYNVPGRTGVSLTPATIAKLAAHPNIRSLKEATGNVSFTSEILEALSGASFDILSGDDVTYLPLLSIGAVGVVSVASNIVPRAMLAILKAVNSSDIPQAQALHRKLYPLLRDLFVDSNPGPIKHAMEFMGFCSARVRAPLAPLSRDHAEILRASLARCGLKPGAHL